MLVEFRVSNFRSIKSEVALSMSAASRAVSDDPRLRCVPAVAQPLLCAAALYGANASGKSNVLAALTWMQSAVLHSQNRWNPEEGIRRRSPFAVDASMLAETSLFEVVFAIDGFRYRYGFTLDDHCIVEEWLYESEKVRERTLFHRERQEIEFGRSLRGDLSMLEEFTRPNALFLSTAAQFGHARLTTIFRWFRTIQTYGVRKGWRNFGGGITRSHRLRRFAERQSAQRSLFPDESMTEIGDAFRHLLRMSDVGVVDFAVVDDTDDGNGDIHLRHVHGDGELWLPLAEESRGTQTLFELGPAVITALERGSVLIADELEASLHPLLAAQVIRMFGSPDTNPRGAQIVFATHDSSLLRVDSDGSQNLLRSDQIWMTQKLADGSTELYPLTDFQPRRGENVERGYLQGRYGGVPHVDSLLPDARGRGQDAD